MQDDAKNAVLNYEGHDHIWAGPDEIKDLNVDSYTLRALSEYRKKHGLHGP